MLNSKDYDKLKQIMEESPEKKELLNRLIADHQMTLSMVSHEIRNPLTLVYSTLQMIETNHPEVQDFKYWSDLHHDIQYMISLLDELSKYNNGERLHITDVNSSVFFKRLALSFAASILNTDIQFVSQLDDSLPVIQCDEIKLREVFLNLLGNAKDAVLESPPMNGQPPTIRLTVKPADDMLLITIEDNGCGIPKDHLASIFEPFTTYKKNGTGLGLAITSKIIRAHHGTINVSSVPLISTAFTITLPVKQYT